MNRTTKCLKWSPTILKLSIVCCQLSILLSSCMEEDNLLCNGQVTFLFHYTYNPDNRDLFEEEVQSVSLYLFNEEGALYNVLEAKESNNIQLELPVGSYRAVAWGNYNPEYYEIANSQSIEGSRLQLLTGPDGSVTPEYSGLFHGMTDVQVEALKKNNPELSLIKNSNNISVLVDGLPSSTRTIPDTNYSVHISADNGAYNFDNSPVSSEPVYYTPTYSDTRYEGKEYTEAAFRTLRLQLEYNVHISFREDGREVQSDDLVALLLEYFPEINTNEDFDRYSHYRFIYRVDDQGQFSLAKIEAGPWEAAPGQGGGIGQK